MNKKEYENKKKEYENNNNNNDKITKDEIKEMIQERDEIIQPEDIDRMEKENKTITDLSEKSLSNIPELIDFVQTPEYARLGTKAKIPVPIDLNGKIVKVFVRALSGDEMAAINIQARDTGADRNHLAVLKACTDSNGNPYPENVLQQLGYARERDIAEAITIASGESSETTQEALTKKVIDNFLSRM